MVDNSDPKRDALDAFLREQGPHNIQKAAVLVGWALVCDWMDEDGQRWLSKAHSASVPKWTANGMYHDALFGYWPPLEDEDEE